MRYLIPALTKYLCACVHKFSEPMQPFVPRMAQIVEKMLSHNICETSAFELGMSLFELYGCFDNEFLKKFVLSMVQIMHTYKTKTASQ